LSRSNLKHLGLRSLTLTTLVFLFACSKAAPSRVEPGEKPFYPKSLPLALVGYNYTNRYIDSFSVNGQGGGNLYVSSAHSGGGGTVCCVQYRPGTRINTVKVRWQSGACYYREVSSSNEIFYSLHPFFKEQEVVVADSVPAKAAYFEVHFYPDGSVQAAVTAEASAPRLSLSKAREDKTRYPRCPNEEQPAR